MTQYKRVLFSHSCVAYLMKPMRNDRNIPVNAVEDPYLQIRKGGGGAGVIQTIRYRGAGLQKKILALRASVLSKNKRGGGLPWIRH